MRLPRTHSTVEVTCTLDFTIQTRVRPTSRPGRFG